jgi:small subunit ribosomal protein S15
MVLTTDKKKEIMSAHRRAEKDSGSPEVQIALLTARVTELTEHLKGHRKDFNTRRALLVLVNRRSRLLDYLERKSQATYTAIVEKLGIRR